MRAARRAQQPHTCLTAHCTAPPSLPPHLHVGRLVFREDDALAAKLNVAQQLVLLELLARRAVEMAREALPEENGG